jgi:prepilin-type N-terminal cleavage/methylation domain-containing protein/prepilin-type processing-associated H-X9-DG protein
MKNAYLIPEKTVYVENAVMVEPYGAQRGRAFTLVECVVVIGILALLAALLLPALAKSKVKAHSAVCLSNLKQLQFAWLSYAQEHDDALPPNISRQVEFDQVNVAGSWVLGNTRVDTNVDNLRDGVLYPYSKAASVYHCPADRSTVRERPDLVRTRSYSMSLWLNVDIVSYGDAEGANTDPYNRHKLSQIVNPPPILTWVFIDEHPLSIDDGVFLIARGWGNGFRAWSSYRGDLHDNGANLSFADGHTDYYRWRCRRAFPKYNATTGWTRAINADDRFDLKRLAAGA